jgi:hypothetical protein
VATFAALNLADPFGSLDPVFDRHGDRQPNLCTEKALMDQGPFNPVFWLTASH